MRQAWEIRNMRSVSVLVGRANPGLALELFNAAAEAARRHRCSTTHRRVDVTQPPLLRRTMNQAKTSRSRVERFRASSPAMMKTARPMHRPTAGFPILPGQQAMILITVPPTERVEQRSPRRLRLGCCPLRR